MKVISNNKKAFFDFFVSDLVEAGIVLEGCEVKSIRAGGVNLKDSFVFVKNGEMFLKNAYIKKIARPSFQKMSEAERSEELDLMFLEFARAIEREKLRCSRSMR